MWHTTKMALWILASGIAMGGYVVHAYEATPLAETAARGFCAQRDVRGTLFWFRCVDAAVALELQARDAQRDSDTSTILDQMRVNQPKKVGGKARP